MEEHKGLTPVVRKEEGHVNIREGEARTHTDTHRHTQTHTDTQGANFFGEKFATPCGVAM